MYWVLATQFKFTCYGSLSRRFWPLGKNKWVAVFKICESELALPPTTGHVWVHCKCAGPWTSFKVFPGGKFFRGENFFLRGRIFPEKLCDYAYLGFKKTYHSWTNCLSLFSEWGFLNIRNDFSIFFYKIRGAEKFPPASPQMTSLDVSCLNSFE